jgi:hypothetical protein
VYVAAQFIGPSSILNRDALEAALEERAGPVMFCVEPTTIGETEPLHPLTQVRVWRLDDGVIVVPEKAVRMNDESEAFSRLTEQIQKVVEISIISLDRMSLNAAVHAMVPTVSNINSQGSSHDSILARTTHPSIQMLDV